MTREQFYRLRRSNYCVHCDLRYTNAMMIPPIMAAKESKNPATAMGIAGATDHPEMIKCPEKNTANPVKKPKDAPLASHFSLKK